jgi:uncharacterized protein (TIGR00661 family)
MKILYAIQGTGNGHVTRAMEIVPYLKKIGTTNVLLSGTQCDLKLPFEIDYKFKGLSFVFGKGGGVNVWRTYLKMNSLRLLQDIRKLNVRKYDLVISDFEPVSAWACQLAGVPCVGLSNQIATLHSKAPKPKSNDRLGKFVLKNYAPVTFGYGYHFKSLDEYIYTPLIRKIVRDKKITQKEHITVYLPSYSDEKIIKRLKQYKGVKWEIFSKHTSKHYVDGRFSVFPLDQFKFLDSLSSSKGVLCNAGFGTTSEALFMHKKLLVIPMKTQYEQHCNAAMLESMGVPVLKKLKKKKQDTLVEWIEGGSIVEVKYPDNTGQILDTIVERHAGVLAPHHESFSTYPLFQ